MNMCANNREELLMNKVLRFLGIIAGVSSVFLWLVLNFFNPYSSTPAGNETMTITFITLVLPVCLAIIAAICSKGIEMLIAFLCSVPVRAYFDLTPGIFTFFGLSNFVYFVSFVMLILGQKVVNDNSYRNKEMPY